MDEDKLECPMTMSYFPSSLFTFCFYKINLMLHDLTRLNGNNRKLVAYTRNEHTASSDRKRASCIIRLSDKK